MSDRDGLTGDTSSMDIDSHIELTPSSCEIEGLKSDHFTGLSPKIFFDPPLVNSKLPLARLKPYSCDGCLSLACRVNGFCHGFSPLLDFKRNRLLGFMRMIRPSIDL
jgi:hypothetical protein